MDSEDGESVEGVEAGGGGDGVGLADNIGDYGNIEDSGCVGEGGGERAGVVDYVEDAAEEFDVLGEDC